MKSGQKESSARRFGSFPTCLSHAVGSLLPLLANTTHLQQAGPVRHPTTPETCQTRHFRLTRVQFHLFHSTAVPDTPRGLRLAEDQVWVAFLFVLRMCVCICICISISNSPPLRREASKSRPYGRNNITRPNGYFAIDLPYDWLPVCAGKPILSWHGWI
jgi:hypothetical protein